jgi:hypothetical protein
MRFDVSSSSCCPSTSRPVCAYCFSLLLILPYMRAALCSRRNTSLCPTADSWNSITRLCLPCHHRLNNPSNRERLTIRLPARRLCTLCLHVHAVLNLQPTHCRFCQHRERCSRCLNQRCRDKRVLRHHVQREAAHALGLRWCPRGCHRVTEAACTSADGSVHANCLACLDRLRDYRAAHTHAAVTDQIAEQDAIEDREAVATDPIVDAVQLHDEGEQHDVNLPHDSAVSIREKNLIQHMQDRLAHVDVQVRERAFDISLSNDSNECRRCRSDKHDNGKKWPNANDVNPGTIPLSLHLSSSHAHSSLLTTAIQLDVDHTHKAHHACPLYDGLSAML